MRPQVDDDDEAHGLARPQVPAVALRGEGLA